MGRKTGDSLTPEEAKARLRLAAGEFSMAGLVRRHPVESMAVGALLGLVASNRRIQHKLRRWLPVLLRHYS